MSGKAPDLIADLDAKAASLYFSKIASRLSADEKILFVTRWKPAKFVIIISMIFLFFAGISLFYYLYYYSYESLRAACGDQLSPTCRRNFGGSLWIIVINGVLALGCAAFIVKVALGRALQLYVITTKNVFLLRQGFERGDDEFKVKDLSLYCNWNGLNISDGRRKGVLFLDRNSLVAALASLSNAKGGVTP